MDYPEDQGNEIDDQAIKDRDEPHLDATGDDVGSDVVMPGHKICHLKVAAECPEDAHDQGGDADFLDPGRCFPGGEEQRDEKKGDDDHSDGSAGNEEGEQIR